MMIRLRQLLLVLALCCAWPASVTQAQEEADAAAHEADESVTTVEARQHALTTLLADARRHRDAGEAVEAARALNRAGRLKVQLSSPQEALVTFREALTLLKQTTDPPTNIDSLNGLGEAYNQLSKCAEAQTFLRQAITLSEQSDNTWGKAQALLTLSECQNFEDHALALRSAQEALALWQSIGSKRGIARSYAAVGNYQLAQNNLAEATQSHQAALNIWRELGVADEQAEALISLGFIEYRKGLWQNVFAFLTEAQSLLDEKAEPFKMGQIDAGLADAFIESGLPETGLDKYREALEFYRRTQNPRAVISMTWGIGKTYYFIGNYPEALSNLQRALADAESIKETTFVAMCHDFMGRTFAAMNDHATALRHFELAADLYTKVANPMEVARVRALTGQVYEEQGRVEKAREYYRKALEAFRAVSDQVNESVALYALGRLELKQNNLDAAEDYLRQSIEVTENMRRVSTSRDLTAAFSATVHERYETYIECLMRKDRAEPATRELGAHAFETSEMARARSLVEVLNATRTTLVPGLDPQLAEQERLLRLSLKVKEDDKVALLGRNYKKEELDALQSELARLEAEYRQVDESIRVRYPSYEQLARPVSWDLRRIQEQVIADDQTVLLEYSLGAEKSYVWAVTRDALTSYEIPAQASIDDAAEKVYKLLATPPSAQNGDELTRAAEELSRMVLSPVAAHLNKQRIIVVADGALNYIPFQLLPSPLAEHEQLVAGYEVVNAPSASILGQLRQETARRQTPAKILAAFGDPVFASNYAQRKDANAGEELASAQALDREHLRYDLRGIELEGDSFDPALIRPLFFARHELASLRGVAPSEETFVATDFDATRERLESVDLTKFAILHFATHGFLDPAHLEQSGLMLSTVDRQGRAQDGLVRLQDIYNLHAPVDLVVLSACRTALGKEVRGEGLIGLTRGFLYAGASSVVASLWKVDDEATSELMKHFYTNMLQRGMTPAASLRAAQNSIRQDARWRSPYYWAAFTLQGEYLHVIKAAPADATPVYRKVLAGGALLTLLACAAWWYRRRRAVRNAL